MIAEPYKKGQPLTEFDQAQIDLTNHAINGVEKVLTDITQLMDSNPNVYALLLSVAGTLVRSAAMVRQHSHEDAGHRITLVQCERFAMLDLLVGLGITSFEDIERGMIND